MNSAWMLVVVLLQPRAPRSWTGWAGVARLRVRGCCGADHGGFSDIPRWHAVLLDRTSRMGGVAEDRSARQGASHSFRSSWQKKSPLVRRALWYSIRRF